MKKIFFIIFLFSMQTVFSSSSPGPIVSFFPPKPSVLIDTLQSTKKDKTFSDADFIENKSAAHFKYAIKLKVQVELVKDLDLFKTISEWHGTRYVFGGNSKKGIDCSGFTQQVMKEVYNINLHRIVGGQYSQCQPIEKEELQQGDLLFFHTTRAGLSHVGLYLGDNKFIHASCTKGVTVDDLNSSYYKKAYRKAGRILTDQ
jgi:lipoprotein Spr